MEAVGKLADYWTLASIQLTNGSIARKQRCFEPEVVPTLKFATREIYSLLLRKHLIPQFGGHRLCDVSRVEVQQYLLNKLKQGFAWESTNHLRHLLSKVTGTAVNWEYISNNPVRGVKMPERTLKRPHRFLSAEEVRRLISSSKEPTRTIVVLAAMTGLRIGEILALRWGGSVQRDAVNMLADQLLPNVPKLESSGNSAQEEPQVIQ